MVALEAMERARPVIAAEIGGLGELVDDGVTGLLVPPGESEPLARAIVELGSDLERAARMGEAGRRRALDQFLRSAAPTVPSCSIASTSDRAAETAHARSTAATNLPPCAAKLAPHPSLGWGVGGGRGPRPEGR